MKTNNKKVLEVSPPRAAALAAPQPLVSCGGDQDEEMGNEMEGRRSGPHERETPCRKIPSI